MSKPEYGPDHWAPLFSSPDAELAHTAMCLPAAEREAFVASARRRRGGRPARGGAGGIAVTAPDPEWEAYMQGQAEAQAGVFEPPAGELERDALLAEAELAASSGTPTCGPPRSRRCTRPWTNPRRNCDRAHVGAVRAAVVLSGRLGLVVTADGVEELARRGLLPVTGYYKGHAVYDGRALEAFTGTAAAVDATWGGQLRTAGQAAAYLRIRRSDLAHLTRPGILKPVEYGRGPFNRRGQASVPLYRTGDLDALTARPDIDWAAVHATPPRHRSPLAAVEQAENILAALAGQTVAPRRRRR